MLTCKKLSYIINKNLTYKYFYLICCLLLSCVTNPDECGIGFIKINNRCYNTIFNIHILILDLVIIELLIICLVRLVNMIFYYLDSCLKSLK